jgi:DNA-binding NarL/FixJ family response regulator
MPPKILIVDDHDVVRQGVRSIITKSRPEWNVCGEASNGQEAVKSVESLKPDIVILDITMPVLSGIEAAAQISKLGVNCSILILTMHEWDSLVGEIRKAGAKGFVHKSQVGRDLIRAIDTLAGGGTFFGTANKPAASKRENEPNAEPGASFRIRLRFA